MRKKWRDFSSWFYCPSTLVALFSRVGKNLIRLQHAIKSRVFVFSDGITKEGNLIYVPSVKNMKKVVFEGVFQPTPSHIRCAFAVKWVKSIFDLCLKTSTISERTIPSILKVQLFIEIENQSWNRCIDRYHQKFISKQKSNLENYQYCMPIYGNGGSTLI